jgi:hypothetical protein
MQKLIVFNQVSLDGLMLRVSAPPRLRLCTTSYSGKFTTRSIPVVIAGAPKFECASTEGRGDASHHACR